MYLGTIEMKYISQALLSLILLEDNYFCYIIRACPECQDSIAGMYVNLIKWSNHTDIIDNFNVPIK